MWRIWMSAFTFKKQESYKIKHMLCIKYWVLAVMNNEVLTVYMQPYCTVLEDRKWWGAWDTTCGHKAKDGSGKKISLKKKIKNKKGSVNKQLWEDDTRSLSIRLTLELFQWQHLETLLRHGVESRWAFPSAYIILSWTKLKLYTTTY